MKIEKMIKEKSNPIIDVRTPEEYIEGHVAGSINIPLHDIPHRLTEIKNLKKAVVLCCASGNRSSQATQYLSQHGIECCNGGSWMEINNVHNSTK